ncbi:MAG: hypothetical protein PHF74_06655 [Dehalococcoidales bacterium]|nr:hypothetical protein [Dehalococcoidales bacterium]
MAKNTVPKITPEEAQKINKELTPLWGSPEIDPAVKQQCEEWLNEANLIREKALMPSSQGEL